MTSDMQLLHLVFGGELEDLNGIRFQDLAKLDLVGIYPNYATAHAAWKAKGQASVKRDDDADAGERINTH